MSKRDYIKELTDEEIKELIHILGYGFNFVRSREDDTLLPIVEYLEGEEKNDTALFIRCKILPTKESERNDEILNSVLKGSKMLQQLALTGIYSNMSGFYNGKEGFLYIKKFELIDSLKDDFWGLNRTASKETEQSGQEKFAYFMAEKFGNEYIKEYNKNVRIHNENLKKKKQEEKEKEKDAELNA